MSIAVDIVLTVLKSVGTNKVNILGDELTNVLIERYSEKGIQKLYDHIDKEKYRIKQILSKENMMAMNISEEKVDYVVTEVKELLANIEITDDILKKCRYESGELYNYLWGQYHEHKRNHIEYENDVKQVIYVIVREIVHLFYESEEFEKKLLIYISSLVNDTNCELQKVASHMVENFNKLDKSNKVTLYIRPYMNILYGSMFLQKYIK